MTKTTHKDMKNINWTPITKLFIITCSLLNINSAYSEPAPLKLGQTELTPEVHVEYFQTDNAYRTTGSEVDSIGVAVAPTLSWEASQGLTRVTAQYRGNYSNADQLGLDFADHILSLTGDVEFSKKSRAKTELYIASLHEPLGTGLSFGLGGELENQNIFTDIRFQASHTYGVEQARGNVEVGLGYVNRKFKNNGDLTAGSDRSNINPYVNFSLRASGDSRIFLELQYARIDYELDRLDGFSLGTYIGASWSATGKTTGQVKIGRLSREYLSTSLVDSTLGAEASITYRFNDISRIQLEANRSFIGTDDQVSVEVGKELIATTLQAKWWYAWTPRIEHILSFDSTAKDADCPVIDTIFNQTSLEFNYKFRRWLIIGAGFDSGQASGTPCVDVATANPDYGRQNFRIQFDVSL